MAKKKVKEKVFSRIDIEINSACYESYHSTEKWGDWRESYSNSLPDYAELNDDPLSYRGEVVDFQAKVGDNLFVLWADWDSGNSFGRGHKNSKEIIAIFRTINAARALKETLEKATSRDKIGYEGILYKTEAGNEMRVYCSWLGYFEDNVNFHIDIIQIVE